MNILGDLNLDSTVRSLLVNALGGEYKGVDTTPGDVTPVDEKVTPPKDKKKSGVTSYLQSPGFRNLLATTAMAASATSPRSWQYQLAAGEKKKLSDEEYRKSLAQMLGGKEGEVIAKSGLSGEAVNQLAGIGQREKALNIQETGTMPWESEYELALTKIMASKSGQPNLVSKYPATIRTAMDENNQFTPHQLHIWGFDQATGNYTKYLGPLTKSAEGGGSSSVETNKRMWFNTAVKNSYMDPSVQKYAKGGIMVNPDGSINVQWTDPKMASDLIKELTMKNLTLYSKLGTIPEEWVKEFQDYWNISENNPDNNKKLILE